MMLAGAGAALLPLSGLGACSGPNDAAAQASAGAFATAARPIGGGSASFYASRLEGRPTASGGRYSGQAFTAAHRSLPFGSMVRVINRTNGRSVTVRINDRGPFVAGRVIDVSRAAAIELGLIGPGHAPVDLELIEG